MERISIFNYEAFYLDFLEGNLNEADTVLLLDFLEKHPDLVVDMEEYPTLEDQKETAGAAFLAGLKQVDLEHESISEENYESFIIAAVEEQLTDHRLHELETFLQNHPQAAAMRSTYEQVKLVPDLSVGYGDKRDLKQKRTIVLWQAIAVAASILAFLLFYGIWKQQTSEPGSQTQWASGDPEKTQPVRPLKSDVSHPDEVLLVAENNNSRTEGEGYLTTEAAKTTDGVQTKTARRPKYAEVAALETRQVAITGSETNRDIVLTSLPPVQTVNHSNSTEDQSHMAMNDMRNPIKPITKRLSEFTDTDIDVRTAKSTPDKRGGFYLKIGKFEVEHPSRKR